MVETGSIAAAARKENLTAAAIGQRIQTLEQSLASQLLIRSARSVTPNERCLNLLPAMREIIRMTDELQRSIGDGELAGHFRIGMIPTALICMVPNLVGRLSAAAPLLQLRIVPGCSHVLYEMVVKDELDAAILVHPPFALPKVLRCDVLRSEPLALVANRRIAHEKVLASLRERPLIQYDSHSWDGQIASRYLVDNAITPRVHCEIDSLEAITMLVKQGRGISLVPAWAGLTAGEVHATPVPDAAEYARDVVFLRKAFSRRTMAVNAVRAALVTTNENTSRLRASERAIKCISRESV